MASKFGSFFSECVGELRKVVWPSREDVIASVKVVVISTFVLAILLGLLDAGFTAAFRAIMK
ncbi:MAG: preprotein translocase subunit SecE [Treponema sp.]|nr:preprotein translocase subunit SecE [Treponema sp.]